MADDLTQLQDIKYEYKPRWSAILFGVLLCGAAATVFAYLACSNFGLRIWGIQLPPDIAAGTWATLAVTSLGGVFLFLLMAAQRVIRAQRIVITPAAIIVPKRRLTSKMVVIPFSTITEITVAQVNCSMFLTIKHQGRPAIIASSLLPERENFDEIHKSLVERVEASRRGIKGWNGC